MAADNLVTHGASASAAVVLTQFSRNIPASEGLNFNVDHGTDADAKYGVSMVFYMTI